VSCPRLYATPLALHDVRDIESHVRALLDIQLSIWHASLDTLQYQDALSYLLLVAYQLALRYDPSASSLAFSTFSRRILRVRVADWYRDTFGDARYDLHGRETSYDAFLDRRDDVDEDASWLDRHSPTSRADRVDELHRDAYVDSIEDLLTRVALAYD
jgi:hypothetical protein